MPTLSYHNHQKFEIFAFAELKEEDKVSLEYKSHIDHWIRTEKMNDDRLVQKIRSLGIDILVDLAVISTKIIVWGFLPKNLLQSHYPGWGMAILQD